MMPNRKFSLNTLQEKDEKYVEPQHPLTFLPSSNKKISSGKTKERVTPFVLQHRQRLAKQITKEIGYERNSRF